jgi:hypothetical protein
LGGTAGVGKGEVSEFMLRPSDVFAGHVQKVRQHTVGLLPVKVDEVLGTAAPDQEGHPSGGC